MQFNVKQSSKPKQDSCSVTYIHSLQCIHCLLHYMTQYILYECDNSHTTPCSTSSYTTLRWMRNNRCSMFLYWLWFLSLSANLSSFQGLFTDLLRAWSWICSAELQNCHRQSVWALTGRSGTKPIFLYFVNVLLALSPGCNITSFFSTDACFTRLI